MTLDETSATSETRMRAILDNFYQWMALASTLPGAQYRDDAEELSVLTGLPIIVTNVVARMQIPADLTDEQIDARIERTLAPFRERHLAMRWYTDPLTQPADLGTRLLAHGVQHLEDRPCMAISLDSLPNVVVNMPQGLSIVPVDSCERLEEYLALQATLSGVTIEQVAPLRQVLLHYGLSWPGKIRHLMALLDGAAMAAATLFLAGDSAGIYNVATLPAARRRGIGAAVTVAALREGQAAGMRIGVLEASAMGHPLYQRLGFDDVCTMGVYQWTPAQA